MCYFKLSNNFFLYFRYFLIDLNRQNDAFNAKYAINTNDNDSKSKRSTRRPWNRTKTFFYACVAAICNVKMWLSNSPTVIIFL